MAQKYPLNPIIHMVDKKRYNASPAADRVCIDCRTGKAKDKVSILDTGDYFLVLSAGRVKYTGSEIHVEDETGRSIKILPTYRLSCPPGNQRKVAEALYGESDDPAVELDRKMEGWIVEAAGDDPAGFINTFLARRSHWQEHISEKVKDEIGLAVTSLELALDGEADLKTLRIELRGLLARPSDLGEEQTVDFAGDLRVNEQNRIDAIATHSQRWKLKDLITTEVVEFFLDRVTFEQLYGDLGGVREELRRHLNARLAWAGRQFAGVYLSRVPRLDEEEVPPYLNEVVPVLHDVPEYKEILIETSIRMVRQDAAKFKVNKPKKNLKEWLTDTVTQVVSNVFFGKTYVDILLKRDQLQNKVKAELGREAAAIGYDIRQLITIPDLEPIVWLEKIEFQIDEEFTTRVSQKVKLTVFVRAKLKNLRDVESYLNRRQSVPSAMRDECIGEIRHFIHEIDTERFYTRFDFTTVPDEKSVRERIIEIVKESLERKFNAEVISVAPEQGETELAEKPKILMQQWHDFEANIESRLDLGKVTITGKFRVTGLGLNGWGSYESQTFEIEDVKKHIQHTISTTFSTYESQALSFTDGASRDALERALKEVCGASVLRAYGLMITFDNVDRKGTELEDLLRLKLAELRKNLIEAEARGDEPKEIQDFESRIEALEKRLRQIRFASGAHALTSGGRPPESPAALPEPAKE